MSETPDRDPGDREFGGEQPVGKPIESGRPPRGNRTLWIAGAVVLVVAIVLIVVVSVSGDEGSESDEPTGVANAVVNALNARDEVSIRQLMCEPRVPNVLTHIEATSDRVQHKARLNGSAAVTGDSAVAKVVLDVSDQQVNTEVNFDLYLAKRG